MRSIHRFGLSAPWALVVGACLLAGCTKQASQQPPPAEEMHILQMARLWNAYKKEHSGKMPGNAAELKSWTKGLPKQKLAEMNIDDVETAFISPRDKQPYKINKPANPMGFGTVAYEQTGVNGKRKVASNMGNVTELNEEEFRQAVPSP